MEHSGIEPMRRFPFPWKRLDRGFIPEYWRMRGDSLVGKDWLRYRLVIGYLSMKRCSLLGKVWNMDLFRD